jgi:hypothetical protein
MPPHRYFVDEAGDGVLFGQKGRCRLDDADAMRFFMLGMVSVADENAVAKELSSLRTHLTSQPLYASIPSLQPQARKTARVFHAKDDHAEIRSKVFELLITLDFKFYAVIKDMRRVLDYARQRNTTGSSYRYHPNEVYDFSVRLLFKERLHQHEHYEVVFARRGRAARTKSLRQHLEQTRLRFLSRHGKSADPVVDIAPAHPWQSPCLQVADYCLWALQRCYEREESRFLESIWAKVSLIHDVDDTHDKPYGRYLTRNDPTPTGGAIKNRRI